MSILKIRNMKKVVLSLVLMIAAVTVSAQQIAVVSSNGATTMCQTLGDAISKASSNSVIYLPAGGFQISDDVKISKKLTIVGVTHKANSDNVEGNTIISGNLNFVGGSDNSAVMGCYISGNVYIGNDGNAVNGILVKYCNLGSMQVKNNQCSNTKVNQCYVRSHSNFGNSGANVTNNVMHSLKGLKGGDISYNVFLSSLDYCTIFASDASVKSNVFFYTGNSNRSFFLGDNLTSTSNLFPKGYYCGDDPITVEVEDFGSLFEKNNGITPASNYHFKEDYSQYESKAGLYSGGTGFSEGCMPPVPYVSVKEIDEQTDAAGNLKVTLRVKAGNN